MATWIYNFSKPPKKNKVGLKNLLGGKGANLSEMIKIGLPVPPGFTISTEACNEFYKRNRKNPKGLDKQVKAAIKQVEKKNWKKVWRQKKSFISLSEIRRKSFYAWHDGYSFESRFK